MPAGAGLGGSRLWVPSRAVVALLGCWVWNVVLAVPEGPGVTPRDHVGMGMAPPCPSPALGVSVCEPPCLAML